MLRSLPRCSCQDQRADAGRLALLERAAGDCVELVSGCAHIVEHQDVASLRAGRVGDVQDLAEGRCGYRFSAMLFPADFSAACVLMIAARVPYRRSSARHSRL